MTGFLWWLLLHLPWEIQAIAGGLVLVAVAWFIPPLRHWLWIGALALVAIVGAEAVARRGYERKTADDMRDANKALDRAADARSKAVKEGKGHEYWRD